MPANKGRLEGGGKMGILVEGMVHKWWDWCWNVE